MRAGIFGAGQAGLMLKAWLPATTEVKCFFDNDNAKQGSSLDFLPVLAWKDAPPLDAVFIAVLNSEAAASIRGQIRASGFEGEVLDFNDVRRLQDVRLASLRLLARQIIERNIPGALAELGVYRGGFAAEINRLFPDRKIYLFDTFAGFDIHDVEDYMPAMNFSDTSVDIVKDALPNSSQAVFVAGRFLDSLSSCQNLPENYALVSLDVDLYNPTIAGLRYFWPRLSDGGVMLIHDYTGTQFPDVRKAVNEYCKSMGLFVVPLTDLHGTAVLIKQGC